MSIDSKDGEAEKPKIEKMKRSLEHKLLNKNIGERGTLHQKSIVIHPGPKSWKTATLTAYTKAGSEDASRSELKVESFSPLPAAEGDDYDFKKAEYHWQCKGDEEIEALRLLLNEEFPAAGHYYLINRSAGIGEILQHVQNQNLESPTVVRLIKLAANNPDLADELAASPEGVWMAEAIELKRRRDQLSELRRIVEDPESSERDHIHPQLKKMGWIFGGSYIGQSQRSRLNAGDVVDISLLRPDGSLHIVELKAAKIPQLVIQYRGTKDRHEVAGQLEEVPLAVGKEVHFAASQSMNYLCHLDEGRDGLLSRYKIDARRASATVLIGHPEFVAGYGRKEVDETIRIYNSHHSRVQVQHYAELIESAARSLSLVPEESD